MTDDNDTRSGAASPTRADGVALDSHERQDSALLSDNDDDASRQAGAMEASETDHHPPKSNDGQQVPLAPEEEEELKAWQLRFRFQDYKMANEIYRGFLAAGWTHRTNTLTYHAPRPVPDLFDSVDCNQLFERLDRFRTPNITNTLQLPPDNPLSQMSAEEIQQGRRLRHEVLEKIYRLMDSKSRSKANKEFAEDVKEHSKRSSKVKKAQVRRGARQTAQSASQVEEPQVVRRSTRHAAESATRSTNQVETATIHEKGADNFLRRSRGSKTASSQDIAFLDFPSAQECVDLFCDYPTKQINEIEDGYKTGFDDWMFLLTTQNSLLLYGLGSKRHLLDAFAQEKLEKEGDVFCIDGYDREVRIDAILHLIVNHFLGGKEPEGLTTELLDESIIASHEIVRRATRISQSLARQQKNRRRPLYIVLHNIDGTGLRSRDVQEALAALVSQSAIEKGVNAVRLVASVDHINASALLWDNRTSAEFSWIWKEVNTYRPYLKELEVAEIQDHRKSSKSRRFDVEAMDDTTFRNVLTSLAPRHAEVVRRLATLQWEDSKPVDLAALFQNCKHNMTVTGDSQLRIYLGELIDHGIVESRKDSGREWLRIPFSREKLHEIINFEVQK